MDCSKLPVAKRTRSGCDKIWHASLLKERAKKGITSGAGAPVPEIKVECVDLAEDEVDEGLSVVKKGESSKSRKCEKNGGKMGKDGHASDDEVIEMLDSSDGVDDDEGVDKCLSDDGSDSGIVVISVVDTRKENQDERMGDEEDDGSDEEDVKEDVDLDARVSVDLSYKSTSSEDDTFDDESDESYREEVEVGVSRSNLDDSSSSEDEGEDDSDDEVRWEKKDAKCKGKGRMAEGGQRGNKKRKQGDVEYRVKRKADPFEFEESNYDDDEVRCRVWEKKKKDVKCKGKGRIAEGGQRGNKNDKRKQGDVEYRVKRKADPFEFEESNYDDAEVRCSKGKGRIAEGGQRGNKNDKRKQGDVEYRVKRKVDPFEYEESNYDNEDCRVWKKEVKCKGIEVVEICSSSESDNGGRGNYDYVKRDDRGFKRDGREKRDERGFKRDSRERQKNLKMAAAKRKADQNLDRLKILADSLHGEEEALKKFEEEKPKYKFWFKDEDEKAVEKSDFDKHVDELFKQMDRCLAFEKIGSSPLDIDCSLDYTKAVDNGDHCETQTNQATLCSQGNHHLVLDEQIGIICKYCSHVHQEIKHILPTFSKSSPQTRRRGYFVESGCPIYSDDFRYTGARRHDSENYKITGTVWDLVPGTWSSMYEHQREGFEFIWKNLVGGIIIEELEKPLLSSGSGCIISHAPGTGKTRLTIIFLQSFMKLYPDSRPVIIAPKSMLLTWEEEFKKWNINMPFHNLNNPEFTGQENPAAVSFSGGMDSRNNEKARLVKLLSWQKNKSILGITYALFDKLVREATKNANCNPIRKQMGKALLKFPSLLVLDEGHTPRNDQSSIYNSLLNVDTERRIILSGTPFQNNFDELYNTLRLVNPKFDGEMKKNLRNISKELKSKWSGPKLGELKVMISPFVHVHKGQILQNSCPGLKDALIRLQPTDLQQELIRVLSTNYLKAGYLELSYMSSLVSVHPSLLPKKYFQEHQFSTYKDKLEKLERDPYSGAKTKFVVELCRLSEALNEKVLIYSQYIDPLIFIKMQLQTYFGWTEREVLYMDGAIEAKQRQNLISSVNDPRSKARVLMASIKACSEGINLVGASRVVLLDVVWNPSVERQAISRAYRLGQKKMVYTYHLIGEEMDNKKYLAQTAKDRLSEIVFSSNDRDSCKENVPNVVSEDEILQKMIEHNDKLGGMFKQIVFQPKDSNLIDTYDLAAEEPN